MFIVKILGSLVSCWHEVLSKLLELSGFLVSYSTGMKFLDSPVSYWHKVRLTVLHSYCACYGLRLICACVCNLASTRVFTCAFERPMYSMNSTNGAVLQAVGKRYNSFTVQMSLCSCTLQQRLFNHWWGEAEGGKECFFIQSITTLRQDMSLPYSYSSVVYVL